MQDALADPAEFDRRRPVVAALLLLLCVAAYLPTLGNGYIWDDDDYVTDNKTLHDGAGLRQIWTNPDATPQYYPLVHTTFWIEYHLWGLRPLGYHLTNLLLHAAAVLLVWRLLRRLGVPGAWFAAALFAVHPVGVESVAWITERKNVLSLPLALASMWCFLRALPPTGERLRRRCWGLYGASLGLFVLALLSKTVVCSVPAVLLLLYWWRRGWRWREDARLLAWLAPFFVLGLVLALHTAARERLHVGAVGAEWDHTWVARVLIAGRALWFYLSKLAWPHPLIFFYERWRIDPTAAWQYVFPLAWVAVLVLLWVDRARLGRGPLTAFLIFSGVLVPALGFVNVYPHRYSYVADHFQYQASIAIFALVGAWLAHRRRQVRQALAVVLLIGLGLLTAQRCRVYANERTLWEDTIRRNPTSWAAHHNLGYLLDQAGCLSAAEYHFRRAIARQPDHGKAHMHLAMVLEKTDRPEAAAAEFARAMELLPNDETVFLNAGNFRARRQEWVLAIARYRRALEIDPNLWMAHLGAANVFMQVGEYAKAEIFYRNALRLHGPDPRIERLLRQAVAKQSGSADEQN